LYKDNILLKIKTQLDLKTEYDTVLENLIDDAEIEIITFCNRKLDEIETNASIQLAIQYLATIKFNKRFKEGINSESVAGFSTNFELESNYKSLVNSIKKPKFL